MKLHRNAALSWSGRRLLAVRVLEQEWTLMAAAEAAGVSVRCARKWVGRYKAAAKPASLSLFGAAALWPHPGRAGRGHLGASRGCG